MNDRALILAGGWPGHQPSQTARLIAKALEERGMAVELARSLHALDDQRRLRRFALIVPIWTMGRLSWSRQERLRDVVSAGTGLGGIHGSGDAFRAATEYQYVLGGQFVAHPGGDGVVYAVQISDRSHPITLGMDDFRVCTERYHLHVDPSIDVLATTAVPSPSEGVPFDMPVAWTRQFGRGRVFYSALGHSPSVLLQPAVFDLSIRGLLWAAGVELNA